MADRHTSRRGFLIAASLTLGWPGIARSSSGPSRLPVQQLATDLRNIGYHAGGPEDGRPVVLVHDLGSDIDSYAEVAGLLAAAGMRVLMPKLHDHRTTQYMNLGADLIALINALHIPEAVFAGIGLGAQAARAFAVLKPSRCIGLVAVAEPKLALPPASAVPTISLDGFSVGPQAFADAVLELVRVGKWRT
jgi:pimeloyl-ACP methyl ester carboxylesterase